MAALAFSALNMNAQKVKVGVNAGVGVSNIVGSDSEGIEGALSYKVGATVDFNLCDNFAIISGLDFINKTHKETYLDKVRNKMFLELPILAAFKIHTGDNNITLKAGPYVAYGVAGTKDYVTAGEDIFQSDVFNRGDVGIKVGASYDLKHFSIGAEFSRGFRKINERDKAFNQVYGIVLGYKF